MPATRPVTQRSPARRPRLLLLAEVVLLGLILDLLWWLAGALLVAGFLADRGRVPPAVVDAGLDPLRATLAFGLPLVLVAVTEFRLRLPARATWPLTPLIVAWLVIAFAETAIASADLTAIVLAAGVIPAVPIGSHLGWLRRVAGRSPEGPRWTRPRRLLTMTAAIVVAAWTGVYLFLGMMEASGQVRLPPGLFPLGG